MATEYSIQKMVSDGTLSTITLGIQYLQRNDIYMRIAGEETPQSGAPSGYTWSFINNTTLKILPVVPNGVEVVVYRRTDVGAMYNIYSQNAQFDEATIDENNQQLLYIAQEYLEQGIPGAGVDTMVYLRDDGSYTYYRIRRTDGSYSEEFHVPSASSSTKVLTRESLRRSYAEVGYTLVDGSFEAGGTLANVNDVLLQENTGKGFTGPVGHVGAGTDPTVVPGFVDRSGDSLRGAMAAADSTVSIATSSAKDVGETTKALLVSCVYAENFPDFAAAVATGKNVLYSSNFTISSPITLSPNQRISRIGNGVITFTGSSAFTLSTGNVLEFCEFAGPSNVPALRGTGNVKDIKIIHPVCNICPLLRVNASLTYADADWEGKTNIAQNITVINPVGYGNSDGPTNTFMQTHYIDGFTVIGGYCENYYFGHWYWGGDSAFDKDGGSKSNVRKCDNINLIGFTTKDAFFSGLWGSMAQKVRRVNCSVVRSTVGGDVGIDDEGTVSAINTNCHAEGYANGNFSGFYGFSELQYIGCTSRQYAGKPHYRNYNSAGTGNNSGRVLIDGGSWVTIDPENGFASIDTQNGPAESFTITSSTMLRDTKVVLYTNRGDVKISGPKLQFSTAGSVSFSAIYISVYSGGVTTIEGVELTNAASPPTGSHGISVNTRNSASSDHVVIRGNNTPLMDIALEDFSGSSTNSGNVFCYDNIASAITKSNPGGGKALTIVRGDGNFTPAGVALTV